jgi:phosphoglycolate phosphatase
LKKPETVSQGLSRGSLKFFFIDLDGTLEDSKQDMTQAVSQVRQALHLSPIDVPHIEKNITRGMDELYKNCFGDYLEHHFTQRYEEVKRLYEDEYLKNCCIHTACYEGIPDAIEYLSKQGKVIVVTNKPEHISRELLKRLGLMPFIADVMGGDSCEEIKPHPLLLQIMAQKHRYQPEQGDVAYMIGDTATDVLLGQRFGIQTVWCQWGYAKSIEPHMTDFTIQRPAQLKEIF